MKASHNLAGVSVTFDEDRLIPNAGLVAPALGIRRSSSKVTDTPARLCDAFIRQMPSGSGLLTTSDTVIVPGQQYSAFGGKAHRGARRCVVGFGWVLVWSGRLRWVRMVAVRRGRTPIPL